MARNEELNNTYKQRQAILDTRYLDADKAQNRTSKSKIERRSAEFVGDFWS